MQTGLMDKHILSARKKNDEMQRIEEGGKTQKPALTQN